MTFPINYGWDFVHKGKSYQYKEGSFIAMVTILEDRSDSKYYRFILQVDQATAIPPGGGTFDVIHLKNPDGAYPGMSAFFKQPVYFPEYTWTRSQ